MRHLHHTPKGIGLGLGFGEREEREKVIERVVVGSKR